MTAILYSDTFWAVLMVCSIILLLGSFVAWGIKEWKNDNR